MAVNVKIPTPLRSVTGGAKEVEAQGQTVGELIDDLERLHPGIKDRLCDEEGEVRRFVNIFVGGEDIRFLDGLATIVREGGDLSIVPAVAGGQR